MGFNAVHLLPITTLDTSESPYAAMDLFDIDHSYLVKGSRQGGLSQLEEYIAEARTLNIRLCFDLVLNHVGVHSAMARRAPDWDHAGPESAGWISASPILVRPGLAHLERPRLDQL